MANMVVTWWIAAFLAVSDADGQVGRMTSSQGMEYSVHDFEVMGSNPSWVTVKITLYLGKMFRTSEIFSMCGITMYQLSRILSL